VGRRRFLCSGSTCTREEKEGGGGIVPFLPSGGGRVGGKKNDALAIAADLSLPCPLHPPRERGGIERKSE